MEKMMNYMRKNFREMLNENLFKKLIDINDDIETFWPKDCLTMQMIEYSIIKNPESAYYYMGENNKYLYDLYAIGTIQKKITDKKIYSFSIKKINSDVKIKK